MVGRRIQRTRKGEKRMSFLCGLFAGSSLTILFVAMTSVGNYEKKLEDEEQKEWINGFREKSNRKN